MLNKWLPLLIIIIFLSPVVSASEPDSVYLIVGETKILSITDFTRVSTSNPAVIEIVVTSGHEILLNAKKIGLSVVHVWTRERQLAYRISVQEDFTPIAGEIARLINNPAVQVTVNEKFVVLNGTVANSLEAEQAIQYGKMYRENVINNLSVKSKYQILLSIVVTEMKKDNEKKYGFTAGSWWLTKDGLVFHDWEYPLQMDPNIHMPSGDSVGAMLNAMQRNGDAKILAAPSILTVSGKEAFFLAGGEIPIPMADGKGGVTINWKEYGIKLKVMSTLEKDNMISMEVSPEVSSIDWANAILVSGYKLPALTTRKATTNVQFFDGATLVIGGLLKREDSVNVFKLPILGDLPIIGSLFRSKNFQNGDTELLFFVTPKIIKDESKVDPGAILNPAFQGPFFQPDQEK